MPLKCTHCLALQEIGRALLRTIEMSSILTDIRRSIKSSKSVIRQTTSSARMQDKSSRKWLLMNERKVERPGSSFETKSSSWKMLS